MIQPVVIYCKLLKIIPLFCALLWGKVGRGHLLKWSVSLMHMPPPSSLRCYARQWQSQQQLRLCGSIWWKISSICVNTKLRLCIGTTCIFNGDRGWPCIFVLWATKTLVVISEQSYSDFVYAFTNSLDDRAKPKAHKKACPEDAFHGTFTWGKIPTHNQKCWQSLNLVVCPQTDIEKDWGTVNLVVVSQVRLLRSVAVSCLRYFNKAI